MNWICRKNLLIFKYFIFNIFYLRLYISFLTALFFTTSLSLIKSTGTGISSSASCSLTSFYELPVLIGAFFNLSISNLSTFDFKLARIKHFSQF